MWRPDPFTGTFKLRFMVEDADGLSSEISLMVNVVEKGDALGEAQVSISFNSAPTIRSLHVWSMPMPVGEPTYVGALVHDPDSELLSYSWSATCASTFENAHSLATRFTPSEQPAGACNNCLLHLTVTDNHGGQSAASLALCVGDPLPIQIPNPPVITRTYRSSDTAFAGQTLTYEVTASDPDGGALTFSWSATGGSLGTPESDASHSRITWTAPSCAALYGPPTITAIVTNAFNGTTTGSFTVSGLPECAGWSYADSMAEKRGLHTATLLANGQVLVAGGENDSGFLSTAEVYDPSSDTWNATGSMASPRQEFTATLLPNGKVLVAGSYRLFEGASATAEVYDPASGTWSATGSMAHPRGNHTATLLPNGKVLVAGGHDGSNTLATTEVYDPASGTWSAAALMIAPHTRSTATLMPNGKVLVMGGAGIDSWGTGNTEVYDPVSDTWSAGKSLDIPRNEHTATLMPNGKVLISGGNKYIAFGRNVWTEFVMLYTP